jgi:NAD(P)-dependent dehydrogenase (short-subunit alcohol dehydrogenase family)
MTINLTGYFLHSTRRQDDERTRRRSYHQHLRRLRREIEPGGAAYSVSKGAINPLTRQAAADLAPYNIRVNGIISGIVGTPISKKTWGVATGIRHDSFAPHRATEDVAEAAFSSPPTKLHYQHHFVMVIYV